MLTQFFAGIRMIATSSAGVLFGANLASAAVGVLTGIVTARLLGPELRGDLAVLLLWPAIIVAVVDIAILDTMSMQVSLASSLHESVVRSASVVAFAVSLLGMALGYLLMPAMLQGEQMRLLDTARFQLLFIPAAVLSMVPLGALMGLQQYRSLAIVRVSSSLAYAICVGALTVSGHLSPATLGYATILVTALQLPVGVLLLRADYRVRVDSAGGVLQFASTGLQLHATRVVGLIGGVWDRALGNITMSATDIGVYQVPSALNSMIPVTSLGYAQLAFSQGSASESYLGRDTTTEHYRRATALTILTIAVAAPFLPWLVPLVYGEQFSPAVLPSILVACAGPFAAGSTVLQASARSALRIKMCVAAEFGAGLVVAAVGFPLAPRWGPAGLAVAFLAGRLFSVGWMIAWLPPVLGLEKKSFLPWSRAYRSQLVVDLRRAFSVRPSVGGVNERLPPR